ncbi:hypothetical protein BDW74DRAFT_188561 [Aspergillus multicolor]|uniref:Zn(II)2Cys6 transcription factor n=1 Tax=Aspergillus multicolor TaxID=41759 RepID=UPI003CCCCBA6
MQNDKPKRQRNFTSRSRAGCRTCRLRHKKCDETPIACTNCTSNGWKCDGYEVARLPLQGRGRHSIPSTPATEFRWAMTSDEKRCVSFFLHRTVSSLTSFYDSSLWEKLVFQMCSVEPAVYHAVVALSAVNQDLEQYGIPMPGSDTNSSWHRFALEQCLRSFGFLNQRQISQDPQLRKVLLVCCLLFVILELVLGHYDNATVHLQSGLAILKEMKVRRRTLGLSMTATVEDGLLEAFLHLEAQASLHGVLEPALKIDDELLHDQRYEECLFEFGTVSDVQRALGPLLNCGIPFLEKCWSLRMDEIVARYSELQAKQQRLLSCLFQFGTRFSHFHKMTYARLTPKEQRVADTLRLNYLTLDITFRSCLMTGINLKPVWLSVDYGNLYSEILAVMDRFTDRPLMMIETGVCPSLFVVATHCPDWPLRMRAVDALRSWQHCEGYISSRLIADMIVEAMKLQLRQVWDEMQATGCPPPTLLSFIEHDVGVDAYISDGLGYQTWSMPLEPDKSLIEALRSITTVRKWPCVRASGIFPT